jgi:GAF domain-containing protein
MYGLLTVSIPGDFAADEEEQSLFGEVAGDVGYALHNIEMEEEHKQAEEELAKHREHLEKLVRERTDELQKMVNLMAGREVRMAELKKVIEKLRAQLEEAEMTPVADDPLKEGGRLKSDF